jgi:hypothetical protein
MKSHTKGCASLVPGTFYGDPSTQCTCGLYAYSHFGGMTWPTGGIANIEWKLRYSHAALTEAELLFAASILGAYVDLISCTAKKRTQVIRGIRSNTNNARRNAPRR